MLAGLEFRDEPGERRTCHVVEMDAITLAIPHHGAPSPDRLFNSLRAGGKRPCLADEGLDLGASFEADFVEVEPGGDGRFEVVIDRVCGGVGLEPRDETAPASLVKRGTFPLAFCQGAAEIEKAHDLVATAELRESLDGRRKRRSGFFGGSGDHGAAFFEKALSVVPPGLEHAGRAGGPDVGPVAAVCIDAGGKTGTLGMLNHPSGKAGSRLLY